VTSATCPDVSERAVPAACGPAGHDNALTTSNDSVTQQRVDDAASALSDPIRRAILRMLRAAPLSAGAVAGAFSVTRPAISRHLRVLREAGLVVDKAQGRERVYRLELGPLAAIEEFIAELRRDRASEWERRFMALETEVHRAKRESKKRAPVTRVVDQPRKREKEKTG
jgi:DNA-binding transcriptional ArsR family regulator